VLGGGRWRTDIARSPCHGLIVVAQSCALRPDMVTTARVVRRRMRGEVAGPIPKCRGGAANKPRTSQDGQDRPPTSQGQAANSPRNEKGGKKIGPVARWHVPPVDRVRKGPRARDGAYDEDCPSARPSKLNVAGRGASERPRSSRLVGSLSPYISSYRRFADLGSVTKCFGSVRSACANGVEESRVIPDDPRPPLGP
jgi:hypothetical protein